MLKSCATTVVQFRENPDDTVNYEEMEVEVLEQWYENSVDGLPQASLLRQLAVESSQTRQREPAEWERNWGNHWPTYGKWVWG